MKKDSIKHSNPESNPFIRFEAQGLLANFNLIITCWRMKLRRFARSLILA